MTERTVREIRDMLDKFTVADAPEGTFGLTRLTGMLVLGKLATEELPRLLRDAQRLRQALQEQVAKAQRLGVIVGPSLPKLLGETAYLAEDLCISEDSKL